MPNTMTYEWAIGAWSERMTLDYVPIDQKINGKDCNSDLPLGRTIVDSLPYMTEAGAGLYYMAYSSRDPRVIVRFKEPVSIGSDSDAEDESQGVNLCKFYKCASVDTANKTWSGYELVLQDGVYAVSDVETTGLKYNGFPPLIDHFYSADTLVEVKDFYKGFYLVSPTNMTSEENDEWLITASTQGYYNPPYYAFDGNDISPGGWGTADYTSPPHWITWRNKNKKAKIISYSLQASNNEAVKDLTPNTWVLYGSNDGSSWVIVDERTNAITNATDFETYTFECQNPEFFFYYKLYITEPLPRAYVNIGQIKAYGAFEDNVEEGGSPPDSGKPYGYRLRLTDTAANPAWEQVFVMDDVTAEGDAMSWTSEDGTYKLFFDNEIGLWRIAGSDYCGAITRLPTEPPWDAEWFNPATEDTVSMSFTIIE